MYEAITAIKKALAQPEQSTGNILMDSYKAMQSMKVEGPLHVICQCDKCKIESQEPVAWTLLLTGEHNGLVGKAGKKFIGAPDYYQRVNVYTALPRRTWVELTDEEVKHEWEVWRANIPRYVGFAKGIEAKCKQKNGYAEEKNT
jgi:hypothetical protein